MQVENDQQGQQGTGDQGQQGAGDGQQAAQGAGTGQGAGTPQQGSQGSQGAQASGNAAAASQRLIDKANKDRDAAIEDARKLREANESDQEKTKRERDEAIAKQKVSDERADKAEVRAKLIAAATGKAAMPAAVVDLSEAKLLELRDSTDEQLVSHVDAVMAKYGLPAPGAAGAAPAGAGTPGTGTQAGGATGAGASGGTGGTVGGDATGDPTKDYRGGIGRGLLGILGGGKTPPSDDEDA